MDERDERDQTAQERPEDLEVTEEESDQVKGGAWYAKFDGVDGSVKASPINTSASPGGGSH